MKKHRFIPALVLYVGTLIITEVLEYLAVRNLGMRLVINLGTLLLALVGCLLLWKLAEQTTDNTQKVSPVCDKARLLAFAEASHLTRRETEICLLVLNHYSNEQISETLCIAESTVKKHLSHIYEKTNTSGRKELRKCIEETGR